MASLGYKMGYKMISDWGKTILVSFATISFSVATSSFAAHSYPENTPRPQNLWVGC